MEGPRAPKEMEFHQVVDFLNQKLRPGVGWSIANEYPTAINPKNLHNLRIVTDNTKVLSHALIKPIIIKTPLAIYKTAIIGSVVTDEKYRGQGLSQQILLSCIDNAKEQECDLALLWTDIFDFYRKIGFELVGFEHNATIDRDLEVPLPTSSRVVTGSKIDPSAILKLYNQHTVTTHRNEDDLRKFMQIPNSNLYSLWNNHNQLLSYAVEGKGADLSGYIHEWGGKTSDLLALLNFIRNTNNKNLNLIFPNHSQQLLRTIKSKGLKVFDGRLGMVKVLDWTKFIDKIHRGVKAAGIANFIFEKNGAVFTIGTPHATWQTESDTDLVKFLFGPESLHKKINHPDSLNTLNQILPLPLWAWGWDSI